MNPTTHPAPKTKCRVFKYGGTFWVPHFSKRNVFVAPGGQETNLTALENLGAEFVDLKLWPRPWAVKAQLQTAE